MVSNQSVLEFYICLPGTTLRQPYGQGICVMSVRYTKGYCIIGEHEDMLRLIVKFDPLEAELLRGTYDAIHPGYHFNKRHWNSIYVGGAVPDAELFRQIRSSYHLVLGKH